MATAGHVITKSGVRLTEVRVSNFRSLKNAVVELDDLTVIVGANNTGKTSFLDAMHAAIGANRRILGKEDIHLAAGEAAAPQDRVATIDVMIRAVNNEGQQINFPPGSYWTSLWGTGIHQDMDFMDFMAFRTTLFWSDVRGDYVVERKFLKGWNLANDWLSSSVATDVVGADQLEHVALHYIDAKRDLEEDLRRPGSFWRRLTDNLGLEDADISTLETSLSTLNADIVSKSDVLQHLKTNLATMSTVVHADSGGVEIAPIARQLRDLTRGIDVTFATAGAQSFPLARHGMGTRSLASLLVFKAFMSWRYTLAQLAGNETHSLLALEEPESHLHPQAQRALFAQIKSIPGQRIVSTHSPYFAGQAKLENLRLFSKHEGITQTKRLDLAALSADDIRKLERTVIASRGDLLFSRALILFEGETEEQVLPLFAQAYWGANVHELGFSFVSVGGTDYFPFLWMANAFDIPWYVFADGESAPVATLQAAAARVGVTDIASQATIVVIPNNEDLEAHLISQGYADAFDDAITKVAGVGSLDGYISELHGRRGPKVNGVQTTRDYAGPEGRVRAAHDMVSKNKTRFATPLANAILGRSDVNRRIPAKIAQLFAVIGEDFALPKAEPATFGSL